MEHFNCVGFSVFRLVIITPTIRTPPIHSLHILDLQSAACWNCFFVFVFFPQKLPELCSRLLNYPQFGRSSDSELE